MPKLTEKQKDLMRELTPIVVRHMHSGLKPSEVAELLEVMCASLLGACLMAEAVVEASKEGKVDLNALMKEMQKHSQEFLDGLQNKRQ